MSSETSGYACFAKFLFEKMICKHTICQTFARRIFHNDLSLKTIAPLFYQTLDIKSNSARSKSLQINAGWVQQRRAYAKYPTFHYSGDLTGRKKLNLSTPVYSFRNPIKSLDEVPEIVKKLSSLEYADGREQKSHRLQQMYDRIEHLFGADAVIEQKVAKQTVEIRNLIPHCMKYRQDKMVKAVLVEKIQKRKKLLKMLRRDDYQRFLWLLRELRIRYVPIPEYNKHITRRFRKKRAVVRAAFEERKGKLVELKERLAEERVKFEEYKKVTLAQIEEDIKALSLDRSVLEQQQIRKPMSKLEAKEFSRRLRTDPQK